MATKRVIDKRNKEKFQVDDAYLNGMAKKCGWQSTIVYMCICRHADKDQECFPSIKTMMEKLGVGRHTIIKGIKSLEKYNIIQVERERLKNGVWLNNVYILIDKSEWKEYKPKERVVPNTDLGSAYYEPGVVPNTDTKDTQYKDTHSKEYSSKIMIYKKTGERIVESPAGSGKLCIWRNGDCLEYADKKSEIEYK